MVYDHLAELVEKNFRKLAKSSVESYETLRPFEPSNRPSIEQMSLINKNNTSFSESNSSVDELQEKEIKIYLEDKIQNGSKIQYEEETAGCCSCRSKKSKPKKKLEKATPNSNQTRPASINVSKQRYETETGDSFNIEADADMKSFYDEKYQPRLMQLKQLGIHYYEEDDAIYGRVKL